MFKYWSESCQQDPLMHRYFLVVKLPFKHWMRLEFFTSGSHTAPDYATSGNWVDVGPRVNFRYG